MAPTIPEAVDIAIFKLADMPQAMTQGMVASVAEHCFPWQARDTDLALAVRAEVASRVLPMVSEGGAA